MNYFEESPKEECGVIGIFAPNEDVARMTFFGLFALQHRGQEAAGMAVADGQTMSVYKEVGLVSQVFTPNAMENLKGHYAIGHTRYSSGSCHHGARHRLGGRRNSLPCYEKRRWAATRSAAATSVGPTFLSANP